MFMETIQRPSRAAQRLLDHMTPGLWYTRSELAQKFDRTRLNPNEITALETLVKQNYIDARKEMIGNSPVFAYMRKA